MKPSTSPFSSLFLGTQPTQRVVESEWLDELPPDDARAVGSRRDLRRLNWLMRHAVNFQVALARGLRHPPKVIVELGAGDGTLMLNLAAQMHAHWPGVRVILVDRQRAATHSTLQRFRDFDWQAEMVVADAFDWLADDHVEADAVLANLFLHHFENHRLIELLQLVAQRTRLFAACETRRDWPSFAVSRLLGLIGCNSVTRHDAFLSMKAGFLNDDLSSLWPKRDEWELSERRAVVFTHLFVARRKS